MIPRVVTFHYTLKDKSGQKIDSSEGREPMSYLEGSGQIIPGLEDAIKTMKTGDKRQVHVPSAQAYGDRDNELIFDVPRTQFPADEKLEVGMRFRAAEEESSPVFTITEVNDESISVDGNHPLAGQDLYFDIEITETRPATPDEMKHGHVHGPGGHHH